MSADSVQLLRLLAGGHAAGDVAGSPRRGPEPTGFAELLRLAREGEIASGLPVMVPEDAGVTLTESQLARLAAATDRAQAAGAQTALVLIDGMALTLDVGARRIIGRAEFGSDGVLASVDAVIRVPDEPAEGADGATASGEQFLRALGWSGRTV